MNNSALSVRVVLRLPKSSGSDVVIPIHTQHFTAQVGQTMLTSVKIKKMMTVMTLLQYYDLGEFDYTTEYIPWCDDLDGEIKHDALTTICIADNYGCWATWHGRSFNVGVGDRTWSFLYTGTDMRGNTRYITDNKMSAFDIDNEMVTFDINGSLHTVEGDPAFIQKRGELRLLELRAYHGSIHHNNGPALSTDEAHYRMYNGLFISVSYDSLW